MIEISDSAKERLLRLLDKKGEENGYVRVGVESGGCSGLSYKLDFENNKNDEDELIEDWVYIKNMILAEVASSLWGKEYLYKHKLIHDDQAQEALKHFIDAQDLFSN